MSKQQQQQQQQQQAKYNDMVRQFEIWYRLSQGMMNPVDYDWEQYSKGFDELWAITSKQEENPVNGFIEYTHIDGRKITVSFQVILGNE